MNIRRDEWGFVLMVIAITLVITMLPFAYAYLTTPPERQFMGFILNVADHGQYMAWYKGFQSQFLIANLQTSEPNPPVFFNLLWWVLGRLGNYTGLSHDVIYQGFRLISGGFLLAITYILTALNFADVLRRRVALLIILLSSGFGWVLVLMKYTITRGELLFPLDIYIAESNTFLSIMATPHFAEAMAFILGVFALLLIGEQKGQLRFAVWAGIVALLLGWQHGYDLIIVWGVPIAYGGLRWLIDRKFPAYWVWGMLIVGVISCSGAIYSLLLTRLSPIWKDVLEQYDNVGVFTPNLAHIFILMGFPLILASGTFILRLNALIRLEETSQSNRRVEIFLLTWFVVGWALCYIPTDYQIHMLNSWQVPVGLLATLGFFEYMLPWLQKHVGKITPIAWVSLLILFVSLTNSYLLFWRILDLSRHDYPYYQYRDEITAIEWLEQNSPPDAIIFSAYNSGKYIPAFSNRRAFFSHWAQTLKFWDKRALSAQFFSDTTSDTERQAILRQYEIDYVLFGPAERELGPYDPAQANFLEQVYQTPQVSLYAVKP